MAFPPFLTRFIIPLIVSLLTNMGSDPEQLGLFDRALENSDRVLSLDEDPLPESFDYIIIGAGSAGSLLAKRLTESGLATVLVLEAGGDPNPISEVPMGTIGLFGSDMVLQYKSIPMTTACVRAGTCEFPRGRALGGSSSVNGLVYNRCSAKNYDAWANFTGDPTWSYLNVLDAFRSVENYHGFYEDNPDEAPYHGTEGEIHVSRIDYLPAVDPLIEALTEKGFPIVDLNSGQHPTGFSKIDYTIKDGLRHSAFHGFLEPALGRTNLKVVRYAWVNKIHFDPNTLTAIGVSYTRHGKENYVAANTEVILSAGVIDSPKILMLSGIGPESHLTDLGIETLVDLPAVGSNFQDHIGMLLPPMSINKTFGLANPFAPEYINEYVTNMSGPLLYPFYGRIAPHVLMGNFPSKIYNDPTWPDIHAYLNEYLITSEGAEPIETLEIELELTRVDQTGTIRLASQDPTVAPLIDPKFLENPQDTERLVEATEIMLDVFFNSTTFQALGIQWSPTSEPIPECVAHEFPSREYWRCFILYTSGVALHPTSSCRMGPDATVAVVDSKLRVFGTNKLRVIDSSVMPFVPNGNTNFPTFMLAEMGSRFVLDDLKTA